MDDDNDFESPNFQLVGEENIRSPQTLRAFSFPKFDIDDNLQVHLRFDSLAETEVFDIQSQESNWIDEFSSRSTAIGFSSTAAEPCSISRHRNVWSEATSSESVEMLLNSVREDEMVNLHIVKKETETPVMDDHTDFRTTDTLDTGTMSPDKSGKFIESNKDAVVIAQLQNAGTSETSVGEMEETKIDNCSVDKKLQSSVEVTAVKECLVDDENFQVTESSSNFVSINDNAPDVLACDVSLTGMSNKDGPPGLSIDTVDIHTWELSSDTVMKEHDEIGVSAKPEVVPDYKENLTEQFVDNVLEGDNVNKQEVLPDYKENLTKQFVDNVLEGDNVNKHDCGSELLKNPLEPCRDSSLPLPNEDSSNVVFPQNSDGLLESIAYPAKISKREMRPSEEALSITEDLHSAAVLGDTDSERKSTDSTEDLSMQLCEREGCAFSSEGHVSNATNILELVSLGEEKAQTQLESPVDKEGKKAGFSDNDCNDLMDIDTCPQDSSKLETSVVLMIGHDGIEDIINSSVNSEAVELSLEKSSALLDNSENVAATCEKRVQISETAISLTDASKVTEVQEKPSSPMNDYTKDTADSDNNESSANDSIATLTISELMDPLDEPNDGKPGGTISSSPHHLNLLQQVCSDDVLHSDAEQKEVATSPPLAASLHEKDADISPPSVADSVLNGKTTSEPVAMSDTAVAVSPSEVLPEGSGDAFNSAAAAPTQATGENEAVSDALDPEDSKPGTSTPTSGSPKLISYNDNSEKIEYEGGQGVSDPSVSTFETISTGVVSTASTQSSLPRNEVVCETLDLANSNLGTSEPAFGSPTAICSNEGSGKVENQDGRGLSDLPASEKTSLEFVSETLDPANSKQGTSEPTFGSPTVICSNDSSEKVEYQDGSGLSDAPLPASEKTNTGVVSDTSAPSILSRDKVVSDTLDPENSKSGTSEPVCNLSTIISSDDNNCEKAKYQEGGSDFSDPSHPAPEGTHIGVMPDTSSQSTLPTNEAVSETLVPGNIEPGICEPTCGSPTVISSSDKAEKDEYREGEKALSDPPASETITMDEKEKPTDTKERKTLDDDGSFTFEVQPLADSSPKDTGNNWKPFSKLQPDEQSQISGEKQSESKEGSKQVNIIVNVEEDKRNQASGQTPKKGGTPRGDGKEKVQQKRPRGKEKSPSNNSTVSDKNTRRKSRADDAKQYPFVENSSTKPPSTPTIQTSNIPDLNSISSTVLLQQPFTDLQQIQLRAQIFVYGSLIQGLPPDEACMVSAFGGTDGGKRLWEGLWRTALERFQNQKSPLFHSDTPVHTRPVAEQGSSFSALQTKALNSPSGWSGSKIVSSAALSSPISYTTPVWSISPHDGLPSNISRGTQLEFNQVASPLHQYPSSAIRQYANTSTPWLSQSPRPSPWAFTGSSADASAQYSPVILSESGKVTLSSSSVSRISDIQVAPATTSITGHGVLGVSTISGATVETPKGTVNTKIESGSQKSRKRKKTTPEELGLALPISETAVEPASLATVTKILPSSTGFPLSVNSPSTITSSRAASVPHAVSPNYFQMVGASDMQQSAMVVEETGTHNNQSKLQAENAAAHAASAVKHCQSIWDQLVALRKSGLATDVKNKLVAAAAAAAAAASVAKAAAEAAKVASEAALQAKMTVDEALSSVGTESSSHNTEIDLDSGSSMPRSTLVAVSKDKDNDKVQGSCSIISSAREAARRRVEAASAATKRAENLDAIVKAAELAAEAVSHAGSIISMGDPLPFSILELVEAGPEGYWKLHRPSLGNDAVKNGARIDENLSLNFDGDHDGSANQYPDHRSSSQRRRVTDAGVTSKDELPIHSEEKNGT